MVRRGFVVFSVAVLLAVPVSAGEPREQALQLSTEAAAAARAGAHERALALYQRAFDLEPDPILLFNMAVVHEHRGDLAAALELLDRFVGEESDPAKRREGEARREAVRVRRAERSEEVAPDEPPDEAAASEGSPGAERLWDLGFHGLGGYGTKEAEVGFGLLFLKELHPLVDMGAQLSFVFRPRGDGIPWVPLDALLRVKGAFLRGDLEVFGEVLVGYLIDGDGGPGGFHLGLYTGLAYAFSRCCGFYTRIGLDLDSDFRGTPDQPVQGRLHFGLFLRL